MSTRTQVGIRLEDCNANNGLTLSGTPPPLNNGSLPAIRKIVLQNAKQGVLVTGGGLIFQGNTLTDCGMGVEVWNKVNTGIGNQPGLLNADAECTIGGGLNSTDGNSFINCLTSIRTGGKLVPLTISRNKIESSALNFSMGIMVHHLKGRSFSIVNNSLTDCRIGIWSFNNGTNLSSGQQKLIMRNTITRGINSSPVITNGIRVEESTLSTGNSAISSVKIQGNRIRNYRHGITATNCSKVQLLDNALVLNNDLAGIWNPMGALTDYINGIAIHNCPNSFILSNRVSSFATTPYTWASYLVSGFRVAASPGTTVCSNIAAESGTDTIANLPYEIGDPFEFHGNCAPTTFKLNTMNNSTARGLYMGGMPIGGAVNGTVIGDQGAIGVPHDNTWSNISGFHTDFNNVLASNNEFYMTYSTNGFNNNAQPPFPFYTFTSFQTPGTVSCGGTPFIVSPVPGPRELDVFDDIALDSISELGGNDTSRYFGKEFLYNQLKNDSLLTSNSVFSFFKDSVESTNAKPIEIIKEGLIFPLDSSFIDTLTINLAQIQPINNIEANFKTLMEIVSNNPELKDSVFNIAQYSELRRIAHLCPFTDGSAVYSARVILHQFEPDSNYYNYCEFAKRPDRQSNARTESENKTEKNSASKNVKIRYNIVPNPNNGSFWLYCPNDEQVEVEFINTSGQVIEGGRYKPMNGVINLQFLGEPQGLYYLKIQSVNSVEILKLILQQQ